MIYQFIRRLVTPFTKWDAYKLDIIDAKGEVLIKRKQFTTSAQTKAFGVFDIMILNLKKMLAKVPGGSSKLASYAAALFLIREWNHFSNESMLTEDVTDDQLEKSLQIFLDKYLTDEIANSAGGGNIAGIGIGKDGEPGFSKDRKLKSIMRRRKNVTKQTKLN